MDLTEVVRTTGAVRRFTDEPISDTVLHRILDTARFAPSGGNRQGWRVVIVEDRDTRMRLREHYQEAWREYVAHGAAGYVAFAPGPDRFSRAWVDLDAAAAVPAPNDFADGIDAHPVVMIVCVELASLAVLDHGIDRQSIVAGASIYPFCHNIMLAARNEGLGGVMTTAIARREPEVAALLGIPDTHAVASLVALGHPVRQVTKLRRRGVEEFTTVDRFDGDVFTVG